MVKAPTHPTAVADSHGKRASLRTGTAVAQSCSLFHNGIHRWGNEIRKLDLWYGTHPCQGCADPLLFFEHKKLYRSIKEDVPTDDYTVPLMKAAIKRKGNDVTAISYGYTLQLTLQAAEKMHQEHGVEVEVIDLRALAPLDKDTLLESVARTSRVVVVHEDNRTLGIGAEISAIIAEEAFDYCPGHCSRHPSDSGFPSSGKILHALGGKDCRYPGTDIGVLKPYSAR